MLCYAVLCYAMLCYAMLCCAVLCYAMLRYAMLCCAVLCHAMLCYVMLCYAMLCYAMLCYAKATTTRSLTLRSTRPAAGSSPDPNHAVSHRCIAHERLSVTRLVTASADGTARVYNTMTGACQARHMRKVAARTPCPYEEGGREDAMPI
jgi:hypothetical protein